MLSKENIIKKRLCKTCDPAICHNNYDLCQYLKDYEGGLKNEDS